MLADYPETVLPVFSRLEGLPYSFWSVAALLMGAGISIAGAWWMLASPVDTHFC